LAGSFIARCPGVPTVSIAFWSKFCPVDFNRDFAACYARNQNWIYLKFHLHSPVWFVCIGSRKDWHRLWRIKDLTNLPAMGRGMTTSTWLIMMTWVPSCAFSPRWL
jgi:hypothetical protein